MLLGDADLLTRGGPPVEYTRDSRSSPPPPGVCTPSLSVPDRCPARPWPSAGRGGAEGGAGGVARAPRGPCRRSPRPLGEAAELRRRRRGRVRRGRGLCEGGTRRASPALARATREPRGSPVPHLAIRSVLLPRARLLLSPPVSASSLHPGRIHRHPSASKSERWCAGPQGAPSNGPRLGIGGHGRQHGHQALLRQPLR